MQGESVMMGNLTQFIHENLWILDILFILVTATFLSQVEGLLYRRFVPELEKTHHVWINALFTALRLPLQFLIWSIAITYIFIALPFNYTFHFDPQVLVARKLFLIVTSLWFFSSYISQIEFQLHKQIDHKKRHIDKTTVTAICQLLQVIAIVIVGLTMMESMGVSISAILAFGGMGGLAVGFAAKDTLANYLGGLMIFVDRPFSVGDHIRLPERKVEGKVERIGWRLTRMRAEDKRVLFMPNGEFSSIAIENVSRMTHRRIKTNFSIDYADVEKVIPIQTKIVQMLKALPDIDQDEIITADLQDLVNGSLNFTIIAYTTLIETIPYQALVQNVLLKTMAIINQEKARLTITSTTLYLSEDISINKKSLEN